MAMAGCPRHEDVDNLVSYIREKRHDRGTLGSDDVIQQVAMDAVIEAHVQSLFTKRTYWMYQNGMNIQYEGNLSDVYDRESWLRNARRVRETYGMYGLLGVRETTAPHGGAQEGEPTQRGWSTARRREHKHREGGPVSAYWH